MVPPSERELLLLWEQGRFRHPIDRALLLGAWARPDLDPESLAQMPLGLLNVELLQLRASLFGSRLELQLSCERCRELLEIPVDIKTLLEQAAARGGSEQVSWEGFSFRQPSSRDLALVVDELDAAAAAVRLLEACCTEKPADADGAMAAPALLAKVDSLLEDGDPLADPRLTAVCPACGGEVDAGIDPAGLLWQEVQAWARAVFWQIHLLASAYGWTEDEVLALSPARRRVYLELTGGG